MWVGFQGSDLGCCPQTVQTSNRHYRKNASEDRCERPGKIGVKVLIWTVAHATGGTSIGIAAGNRCRVQRRVWEGREFEQLSAVHVGTGKRLVTVHVGETIGRRQTLPDPVLQLHYQAETTNEAVGIAFPVHASTQSLRQYHNLTHHSPQKLAHDSLESEADYTSVTRMSCKLAIMVWTSRRRSTKMYGNLTYWWPKVTLVLATTAEDGIERRERRCSGAWPGSEGRRH